MKVVNKFPPNYDEICKHFNIRGRKGVVFTYGDTLYAPDGGNITDDLMKHEENHTIQQSKHEGGPEGWWAHYLRSAEFRFEQELECYAIQYNYVKQIADRPLRRALLKFFAESLAGPIYGNMMRKDRAAELIKQHADAIS